MRCEPWTENAAALPPKYMKRCFLSVFPLTLPFVAAIALAFAAEPVQQAGRQLPGETARGPSPLPSISPHEVAAYVKKNPKGDLRALWRQLNIDKSNFGTGPGQQATVQNAQFFLQCSGCTAETYSHELDGVPGNEILLKVSDPLGGAFRYLLFTQATDRQVNPQWRLLGHIDHDFARYREPEHSIVRSDGRNWLVVKVQVGSGSGFALYHDRLFFVDNTGIKEKLQVPSSGFLSTCCGYPTRTFTAQITKARMSHHDAFVEVEFLVKYSMANVQLWQKKQRAIYKTDARNNALVLDRTRSALTAEEIAAIYNADEFNDTSLIKYNHEELTRIAKGAAGDRKEWLRHFLNQAEPSPEKKQLQKFLN